MCNNDGIDPNNAMAVDISGKKLGGDKERSCVLCPGRFLAMDNNELQFGKTCESLKEAVLDFNVIRAVYNS